MFATLWFAFISINFLSISAININVSDLVNALDNNGISQAEDNESIETSMAIFNQSSLSELISDIPFGINGIVAGFGMKAAGAEDTLAIIQNLNDKSSSSRSAFPNDLYNTIVSSLGTIGQQCSKISTTINAIGGLLQTYGSKIKLTTATFELPIAMAVKYFHDLNDIFDGFTELQKQNNLLSIALKQASELSTISYDNAQILQIAQLAYENDKFVYGALANKLHGVLYELTHIAYVKNGYVILPSKATANIYKTETNTFDRYLKN